MSEYSEKLKNKLSKISARAKAKAAKKHAKAEKKDGVVVGTKTTTSANPRTLTPHTRTEKVYAKEQKELDKGVVKQSKAIDKDYKKEQKRKKRRSYKGLGLAGRAANKIRSSAGGRKAPRPGRPARSSSAQQGGAAVNKMRNKGRLRASKKAGCYGKDC
jgi:hypothetical protein